MTGKEHACELARRIAEFRLGLAAVLIGQLHATVARAARHADIVKQMPGVRGLRFGKVQSWTPEEAAWDGVGEVWFESIDAAQKAFATEPYRSMLVEDRKKFMREAQSCFVEEETALPPPVGPVS